MRFEVLGLTYQDIDARGRPALPDQPEAIPCVLYDTLTMLAAGPPGGVLEFFQQGNVPKVISNVQNGQLPSGYRFRAQAFNCDFQREPSAGAGTTAGVITDIARILKTNAAIFQLTLNDKKYYPVPLSYAHGSGGETGFLAASLTAPANIQYGNNGIFDGGFDTDGAIWILDKQPWTLAINVAQPFTALSADMVIRFCMRGTLYRPVQ